MFFKSLTIVEKVHCFLLVPAFQVCKEVDTPCKVTIVVLSFINTFLIALWAFTLHSIHHCFLLHLNL